MFRFLFLLVICGLVLSHEHHDQHHHHSQESAHFKYSSEANTGHIPRQNKRTDSNQQLWTETAGAVVLISIAPFLLLCLIPDLNKYQCLLRVLLAFAAGGLLGDAFLHLIPHALDGGHGHDHSHQHLNEHSHDHRRHLIVGLSVIAGIFLFLCVEKLIRLFRNDGHGHSHGQSGGASTSSQSSSNQNESKGKGKSSKKNDQSGEDKKKTVVKSSPSPQFRVAGYLNLAADFIHNFTDGMAIGASFLISRNAGTMTTLTVLFHELPHEIGDYAILIQSGCSAHKAMCLQLLTALGAALGASLSLLAAGIGFDSQTFHLDLPVFLTEDLITSCILPFTAGGFIYIAMTSVLPDLLVSSSSGKKPTCGLIRRTAQNLMEVLAVVFGVGMMAALSSME